MEISFDFSAFQKNLRNLIDSHGITVKGLAEDVNISHVTISRYLNGHREPDLKYVLSLAQYFKVSIDWLLGFSDDRYEVLPQESRALITLFNKASPDDRRVIEAVLSKYREEN